MSIGETTRNDEVPWVLVTNDDGIDSPALVPLVRELGSLTYVRALVPAGECSWSAKTLSRFASLDLTPVQRDGIAIWTADGSPADCANLGVHNLTRTRPDLVVSGINVGMNAGSSFLLSSGTVGAAIEGMLSGIPAVAFSVQMREEDYSLWRANRDLSHLEELWGAAAVVAREVVEELLAGGMPTGASLVSVNMPVAVTPDTPRELTGVTPTTYGSFFARNDTGRLEHRYSGVEVVATREDGDIEALERGVVAITPLQLDLDVLPTAEDRRRFGRQ